MVAVPNEILAVLRRGGLIEFSDEPEGEPLAGGVSSDIWRVELQGAAVCVKRALARLRVAADWRAPVERSGFEADWIRVARAVDPRLAPALLHVDQAAGAIVMPFLPPGRFRQWKEVLLTGEAEPEVAAAVGARLVAVHAATARDEAIAARFATDAIFFDIRLEPYLIATGRAHPPRRPALERLARRTATTKLALVHGDVSPKNILLGPEGPVFLDAECAWYGDPAFDLAFCLNHFLLKSAWRPGWAASYLACFDALAAHYLDGVLWEPRAELEARAAALLPALLLARIDGKSPVEYLTASEDRQRVRRIAGRFLDVPATTLAPIRDALARELDA
ncbi:MAG: aminoglycoside phosphotransferase family protein [Geminicoccaceae bacterium]